MGIWTTTDDGKGGYRDPRLPAIELRWEGETYEMWMLDHPSACVQGGAEGGPQRGRWTLVDVIPIFPAAVAPTVEDSLAHAVAQALFDHLGTSHPAWGEHDERFAEHDCTLPHVCEACFCCPIAAQAGCACAVCRCGQPGVGTGLEPLSFDRAIIAAAKRHLSDAAVGGA